jgi:hypothetical protein
VKALLSLSVALSTVATVASAQTPAAPQPSPSAQMEARYNIAVLEAVFETAVQHGVQMLRESVQGVMPDMMMLTGVPRARGVRLEGYGVFFSVDVPAVSPTVAWTMRTLNQNDVVAANMIQQLRSLLARVSDRRMRDDLDRFLRQVAVQNGVRDNATTVDASGMPPPGVVTANNLTPAPDSRPASAAVVPPGAAPPAPATPPSQAPALPSVLDDPFGAYEAAVKQALMDAMLNHSAPLEIGPDEWLTIAARDNEDRRLSPSNVYDLATIILSIKGSDLAAFRAGRLTREEARARVQVREF